MTHTRTTGSSFDSLLWGFTSLAVAVLLSSTIFVPTGLPKAASGTSPTSQAAAAFERIPFTTAAGRLTTLADMNGQVRIVTTFYAHCPAACPLAFDALQRMEGRLSAAQRARLHVVALTVDPNRDGQGQLRQFESERGVDPHRWTLGRASPADTARLTGPLGASVRVLEDGTIDHASSFVLLDSRGRTVARTADTSGSDAQFAAAVRLALGNE